MARSSNKYVCTECGHDEIRWLGRCPMCGLYNTLVEFRAATAPEGHRGARGFRSAGGPERLAGFGATGGAPAATGGGRSGARSVSAAGGRSGANAAGPAGAGNGAGEETLVPLARVASAHGHRLAVEPEEIARVLGGGLVEGSVVLLGGEPGVGKSTLLTGLALRWTRDGVRVIYVAGEESPAQIRMRAERMGFRPGDEDGFLVLPEVRLETVVEAVYGERRRQLEAAAAAADAAGGAGGTAGGPAGRAAGSAAGGTTGGAARLPGCVVIVDSIQTLHSDQVDAYPGSPTQLRYCAGVLADVARQSACPVFLVGHVTKSGELAGPKLLEHMVDTVLYFEGTGGASIRLVRAVKNRFGTTGELAVLEMRSDGLVPVEEAGALFLSGRRGCEPGSAVCAVRNGSRTFLVEVQALVSPSRYGTPQRVVQGVDSKRVALLAAILEKRAGLDLAGCDLFVKVAGGGRVDDPAADLAIMTALASSLREVPVPADTLVQGEVGLTGEVRGAADQADRLREAAHQGFRRAVVARSSRRLRPPRGLELVAVTSAEEAVALALDGGVAAGSRRRTRREPSSGPEPMSESEA
ncbi:MAG: AAA family ATPase [Candidatus Krumholzibacteriia bacterium]